MTRKIRWGIIGTGTVAHDVAQSFSQVADAELAAVGSRSLQSAQSFASRFHINQVYGSFAELLQDDRLDVIYIATPHHRHKDDCLQCFAAGKAVLCEKPFTLNATEAEQVIVAARASELFCMEAMWMRFIPLIRDLKQRLDQGEIGDIQMLKADFGYPTGFDPQSRFFSLEQGGGSLMDRGIYTLSLAFHLIGHPTHVDSMASIGATGVDHQSAYLLRFKQGALANLSSTLTSHGSNEAMIMGSQGQIRIHDPFYRPSKMTLKTFQKPALSTQPAHPGLKQKLKQNAVLQHLQQKASALLGKLSGGKTITQSFAGNGYQFEIEEVTRCLQRGETESKIMPLDETLAILQTMDAMRKQWGVRYPQE